LQIPFASKEKKIYIMSFRSTRENSPKEPGSPKGERVIDTRAPFQSVRAAVSLFGEVRAKKERRDNAIKRKSSEVNFAAAIINIVNNCRKLPFFCTRNQITVAVVNIASNLSQIVVAVHNFVNNRSQVQP
jgi:hypothetical protein